MIFRTRCFFRRFTSNSTEGLGGTSGGVSNASTFHSNVWSNSQGIIGEYASKPVNLVTLNYLLTLKNGKNGQTIDRFDLSRLTYESNCIVL